MHLFSVCQEKAHKKPLHLHRLGYNVEEKIKRKKYMRVLFEGGCSLLHLKTAECFCTSLHSFTIVIYIVHECGFEAPMP